MSTEKIVEEMVDDTKAVVDVSQVISELIRWGCSAVISYKGVKSILGLSGGKLGRGTKFAAVIFAMMIADKLVKTPALIAWIQSKGKEIRDENENEEESDGGEE